MFPATTIRKLLCQSFDIADLDALDEDGMAGLVVDPKDFLAWIKSTVERFKKIEHVNCYPYWGLHTEMSFFALKLTISPPQSDLPEEKQKKQKPEEFLLTMNCRVFAYLKQIQVKQRRRSFVGSRRRYVEVTIENEGARDGLWIMDVTDSRCNGNVTVPVAQLQQVENFVDAIKSRQQQNNLSHQRKLKTTKFRQYGLQARLQELAQEHQFSFCLGYSARDVNLSLRVRGPKWNREKEFHVAFPQGKFDDVLKQIPEIIQRLERLADIDLEFRTHNRGWFADKGNWIKGESELPLFQVKDSKK